jgi:hypothetical protein
MTTASYILGEINRGFNSAVTLYGGYAVDYRGQRTLFEPARIEEEKRNENGRCTLLRARYADGSGLLFRWSFDKGARYDLIPVPKEGSRVQ